MRSAVEQYIRNCYSCQRSKAPRDKYNEQLIPVAISTQRWIDISMDFIIGLPESNRKNAICTVIDKLSRERHYIACTATDEGTSAEATTNILLHGMFKYHGLPTSIISDREPQFVAAVWKSFCRRLGIICKLSIAFHLEIDD